MYRLCHRYIRNNFANIYNFIYTLPNNVIMLCWQCDNDNRKLVQTVQQHVSYEFIWIRRTCDYI